MALLVKAGLKEAGFAVDHAKDGEDGMHLALTEPYDMAVVDLMLPTVNGLSIIKTMRERQIKTPVLILSARRLVDDRVEGLQTGDDDYLVKPFAFSELVARIQALIWRSLLTPSAIDALQPSSFTLATITFEAVMEGFSNIEGDIYALLDAFGDDLIDTHGPLEGAQIMINPVPVPPALLHLASGIAGRQVLRRKKLAAIVSGVVGLTIFRCQTFNSHENYQNGNHSN